MAKVNITGAQDIVEAECTLEKAINTMRLDRENKEFKEPALKELKKGADKVVNNAISAMIQEISEYLGS
jgi:hypothetical protein